MSYVQGDMSDRGLYETLQLHLRDVARDQQTGGNCLFYLAVADRFFGPVVEQLGHAGLLDEELESSLPPQAPSAKEPMTKKRNEAVDCDMTSFVRERGSRAYRT